VLILDIWSPYLSEAERELVRAAPMAWANTMVPACIKEARSKCCGVSVGKAVSETDIEGRRRHRHNSIRQQIEATVSLVSVPVNGTVPCHRYEGNRTSSRAPV